MAVFEFSFFSSSMHRNTEVTACIPAGGPMFPGTPPAPKTPLRLLILLHGYSGSHADWVRGSSIDQLATMHHMAVFCPSGENSFYIDDPSRDAMYEQFICRELPKFAREVFHISDKVEDTFIGGLSMGGYGAIRNGLKNPDVFGGILAFSSALITDGISKMPNRGSYHNSGVCPFAWACGRSCGRLPTDAHHWKPGTRRPRWTSSPEDA